jgi:pimeloyl-ACP methyl ester carboxylesterase
MDVRTHGARPFGTAIVHGGPGGRGEIAPVARELAAERGVLEPFQSATTVAGQVDELARQLRAHAATPAVLVGHSWGAMLSVLTTAAHPDLVRRLVLISSGPLDARYAPRILAARIARLDAAEAAELEALVRSPRDAPARLTRLIALTERADSVDPIHIDAHADDVFPDQLGLHAQVWADAAARRTRGDFIDAAARLRCPVVVLHGADDPHPLDGVIAPLGSAGLNPEVVVLPRCGHWPWRERHARDAFFASLRRAIDP